MTLKLDSAGRCEGSQPVETLATSQFSIGARARCLIAARVALTSDQAVAASLADSLIAINRSGDFQPRNTRDCSMAEAGVQSLAAKVLGGSADFSREILGGMTRTFFALGEELAPFYVGFVRWAAAFKAADKATEMVFEGRDSLGFLAAYARDRIDIPARHSAVTRDTYHFYGLDGHEAELDGLRALYLANGYLDKRLLFVDFGFQGTNARKEILLTNTLLGKIPDVLILLAYHDREGHDRIDPDFIWNNFGYRQSYKVLNAQLRANTTGYINTQYPGFMNKMRGDPYLREAMQELSSNIKEAPLSAVVPAVREYLMASAYEVGAKFGFFRGLLSRLRLQVNSDPKTVQKALDKFERCYRTFPGLFIELKDFSTRYVFDQKFRSVVDMVNQDLKKAGHTAYRG